MTHKSASAVTLLAALLAGCATPQERVRTVRVEVPGERPAADETYEHGATIMLLTYNELRELVESGAIEGVAPEQINGASIDLTLGDEFFF